MTTASAKIVRNDWRSVAGTGLLRASILRHDIDPEGLDVDRIRFAERATLRPPATSAHVISILRGRITLNVSSRPAPAFKLGPGMHVYVPPGEAVVVDGSKDAALIWLSTPAAAQGRGHRLLVRDETFIAACAAGTQSLRWTLTPQYLSRRIFLHHDPALLSKSGHPVSWFHTTMFDVSGLPANEDGESVFKMSYNSRTEFNVCYDVQGDARVRMAQHPYKTAQQSWGPWARLDGDTTYHLNESAGGLEEECLIDEKTGAPLYRRNKHEVQIKNGHVSLFCLFDPAPAGIERHVPGEYSDYEPLAKIVARAEYAAYQRELKRFDEMIDELSWAKACGRLEACQGTPAWQRYEEGRRAQAAIEAELVGRLVQGGQGREQIISPWLQPGEST